MKNITLSADEALIQRARERATAENKSLNELFREWLSAYVSQPEAAENYKELMAQLAYVNAGRIFDRDELNER